MPLEPAASDPGDSSSSRKIALAINRFDEYRLLSVARGASSEMFMQPRNIDHDPPSFCSQRSLPLQLTNSSADRDYSPVSAEGKFKYRRYYGPVYATG